MKVLGNSLHIANSGKLIARSSKTPSPGGIVFNSDKTKIGKVSYVFGPTKSPYVSIKLFKFELLVIVSISTSFIFI